MQLGDWREESADGVRESDGGGRVRVYVCICVCACELYVIFVPAEVCTSSRKTSEVQVITSHVWQ